VITESYLRYLAPVPAGLYAVMSTRFCDRRGRLQVMQLNKKAFSSIYFLQNLQPSPLVSVPYGLNHSRPLGVYLRMSPRAYPLHHEPHGQQWYEIPAGMAPADRHRAGGSGTRPGPTPPHTATYSFASHLSLHDASAEPGHVDAPSVVHTSPPPFSNEHDK
jgi:hypothetical protein